MNDKTLHIGISDFETIIKDGSYFVDKTMLIKQFYESSSYVSLMPRPKRFGKTLNLSFIEHFFDIQKPASKSLFTGLKIAEHKAFCEAHQNKYPVINISLKGIKEERWSTCLSRFKELTSELYLKYDFLLQSDRLKNAEKEYIESIISETATETKYKSGLKNLSVYLRKHFDKEVIILVDEYDTPIITAFDNTNPPIKSLDKENKTYYEKVINFMQAFLGDAYKGNKALHKGLLTGVMRVGKESIFSEWNNFDIFGITMPYFSDSFGFTKTETEKILSDFGLSDRMDEVRRWYDGYKFGDCDSIYNPWSIVNYVSKEKAGFKPYWVNSGDYSLIKSRIIEFGVKETIQDLIEGKTIDKELKDNFVFQDFETNSELLWTLLTDSGYLTQVEKSKYGNYKLKIPNNEVKIVFTDIIMSWLNNDLKITRKLLIDTADDLVNNRITEFEKGFKQIIGDTLSYFDTAEKINRQDAAKIITHEQIYHVYTLGLLTILADDYIIKSNRESKHGRYDIMLIPHNKSKYGVVIELKQIEEQKNNEKDDAFGKRVNVAIETALNQIEKNKYHAELVVNKIEADKIIKLAIVFAGKEPYIGKLMH